MNTTPTYPAPWGEYRLEHGASERVSLGPLRIELRREGGEIWIATSHIDTADIDADEGVEPSKDWRRWASADDGFPVVVRPALPSTALVVSPEVPFSVAPRASARVYVRVPLVAQVVLANPEETLLHEVPTVVMSNTWWGDFVEGELCLWLPTTARRSLEPEHFQPHLVVCPVYIENHSDGVLEVDKSAVRAFHLSIFNADGRLWADQTHVTYSASEDGSEIQMSGSPPAEVPDASLIVPPQVKIPRGLRARTFARLKSLSGM